MFKKMSATCKHHEAGETPKETQLVEQNLNEELHKLAIKGKSEAQTTNELLHRQSATFDENKNSTSNNQKTDKLTATFDIASILEVGNKRKSITAAYIGNHIAKRTRIQENGKQELEITQKVCRTCGH